jgi:hypothetical protein
MLMNQAYLWPLVGVAGSTVVVTALRCVTLFVGLRLTLRGAPRTDRVAIYREFSRALRPKRVSEKFDAGTPLGESSDAGWPPTHGRSTRRCRR